MQEEVEQKTFNIVVSTTKLTARTILNAGKAAIQQQQAKMAGGKQSVRIYKSYGAALYREMLSILVDAWGGDSDSFLSGILHGMARFLALYQGEYSRDRLILRLHTVHPKTITRLAQNDTGNVADRHMKQILSIYNGAGRAHSLPCKR